MKKIDVDSDDFYISKDSEIVDVLLEDYPMIFHKITIALETHYEEIRNAVKNK
jgi:hypothetical protein